MKAKIFKEKEQLMKYGMWIMLAYGFYLLCTTSISWFSDVINQNFKQEPQIVIMSGNTFYVPQEQNKPMTLYGMDSCINDLGENNDCIIIKPGIIKVLVKETGKIENIIVKQYSDKTIITNEKNHFLSIKPN